ncbi:hypothetical protein [Ruminobacter sp. RM87]|uniref:hypothetical protein n=1 Tax=Ruminobacter sp. RM87 TaxID=1200567 RepID=UPI0004E1895A|nr:hypothetical protein [Ruminobacter sp. RM87]
MKRQNNMGKDNDLNLDESILLQKEFSLGKGVITRVKFKQSLNTIVKLKNEGFTLKYIWAYLKKHQMFDCTYQHFGRLYRACIKEQNTVMDSSEKSSTPETDTSTESKHTSRNKTFDFNPTPNKDELI